MIFKIKSNIIILTGFLSLFTSACEERNKTGIIDFDEAGGVFILNQGNFTYSNSSLSFYNPDSMKVSNDVFYDANDFPLGDVLQSMEIKDSTAWLCISNSGKIVKMNTHSFKHLGTIKDLVAPRFIHFIGENKAWISDLYSPFLTVLNTRENRIEGKIRLGNSSEMIIQNENFVFINSWSFNNQIYVLNPLTDKLLDSITVAKQPNSMVLDKNNRLWVLSDGGYQGSPYGQEKAAITRINSLTLEVERVFTFENIHNSPVNLCINSNKDSLYFLNGGWAGDGNGERGIFRMSIMDQEIPGEAYIEENEKKFYSFSINPGNSEIYCSDALSYLQRGMVYRYSSQGQLIDSFKSGIIPGAFVFK